MHIAVGFTALGMSRFARNRDQSSIVLTNQWVLPMGAVMYLGGCLMVAGCRSVSNASWPTLDFLNVFIGGVTGLLMWSLLTQRSRVVATMGWPFGMMAGIVSATSGCASVTPTSTIVVSALSTLACGICILAGKRSKSSSVSVYWLLFAVFGVSGVFGMALTGVFASPDIAGADIAGKPIVGAIAGNYELLRLQLLVATVAGALSVIAGLILPYLAIAGGAVLQWLFSNEHTAKRILESEAQASV